MGIKRSFKEERVDFGAEHAYEFNVRSYNDEEKKVILDKCVSLLLRCLNDGQSEENTISAFDILYNNVCNKFETPKRRSLLNGDDPFKMPQDRQLYDPRDKGML